jgi:transcriptional regulator with XRE-family HTH domain
MWSGNRGLREAEMAPRLDYRLRELRVAAGLSVADLAERVGTTSATVSRLERGSRGLTLGWMRRFALAIGVRATDLIIEDGDRVTFAEVKATSAVIYREAATPFSSRTAILSPCR